MPSTILIDGQEIPFQEGQTVLQAALAAGLAIPHLCHHSELEPIGSCRLCLVEVGGRRFSACTLSATAGLEVESNKPSLRKLQSALVTFLLGQGDHTCIRCERTGDCRLQEAAAMLNAPAAEPSPGLALPANDDSHLDISLNRSRCVLCGICIQASHKLDGKGIFAFSDKGSNMTLIVESDSGLLKDSAITAEDHAVRLCPVGALTRKQELAHGGFSPFDFFDSDFGRQ